VRHASCPDDCSLVLYCAHNVLLYILGQDCKYTTAIKLPLCLTLLSDMLHAPMTVLLTNQCGSSVTPCLATLKDPLSSDVLVSNASLKFLVFQDKENILIW
jgi:hypothetical protein